MTERDDIPEKIILENGDRARDGDDPIIHVREDDFSTGTKVKIGEYFRQMIPDKTNSSTAAIKDGPNLGVFVNNDPNSDAHLQKQTQEIQASFEKIGVAGYFEKDVVPGDAGEIDTETQIQASNLLTDLGENPELLSDQISATIAENALQGPDSLYAPGGDGQLSENEAGTKEHVLQTRLGAHSPKKLFGIAEKDPTISIKKLRNLGCQILLEASGEHYIPDDPNDIKQELTARAAATALPGTARLGFRVDANRFGASEMINKGNIFDQKPGEKFGLKTGAKASYGSVNNQLVPFSAISTGTSSIIVGTLLVKTFSTIFLNLANMLSKFSPRGVKGNPLEQSLTNLETRRNRLGHNVPVKENDPVFGLVLLGLDDNLLIRTTNEYNSAVQAGLEAFFGEAGPLGIAGGLAPTRIVEAPGYYNGILRLLVRSIADPLSSVLSLAPSLPGGVETALSNGPADVQPITGPASDPTTLGETIKLIKESKFLKFMNVMAAMGDLVLLTNDISSLASTIDDIDDARIERKLGSEISMNVPNENSLIRKNRLSDKVNRRYTNTLAWNANTLPALYMVNNNIARAEESFGGSQKYNTLTDRRNFVQTENKRFSAEFVAETEKRLDAYYMPFYFHDLRTNEIISFHAFIDSISDSHTAEYNESEGYGRIGKIYTYKNTNRSISLSFKVVSTNSDGFNIMWYKLNKLLMMLYPQYTLGRALSSNGKKFVQPFSQLPSASPLIRLRVGDLIKSNFSEFDLARLFGLGSDKFDLNAGASLTNIQRNANILAEYRRIKNRQLGIDPEGFPTFLAGEQFIIKQSFRTIGDIGSTRIAISRTAEAHPGETAQQRRSRRRHSAQNNRSAGHRHGRRRRQPQILNNAKATVVSPVTDGVYNIRLTSGAPGEDANTIFQIDFRPLPNGGTHQSIRFDVDEQRIHDDAISRAGADTQTPETPDDQSITTVSQFFSPGDTDGGTVRNSSTQDGANNIQNTGQGNPVFKSFETTKGKGLAGFIKSLQFNWDGAIWETEDQNSKAPKWCTISMEFAPVHDLNPGIDVNGNMISPLYNIGSILEQMKVKRSAASANTGEGSTPNGSTINSTEGTS